MATAVEAMPVLRTTATTLSMLEIKAVGMLVIHRLFLRPDSLHQILLLFTSLLLPASIAARKR